MSTLQSIIAGIVTYNPDIELLDKNIEAIANQVQKTVIIDNGSENVGEIANIASHYQSVELVKNESNRGVACALNQIGDAAVYNSADYFLTLDQDSISDLNMVDKLMELFSNPDVGGVTPFINVKGFTPESTLLELKTAISSGFIVRTSLWQDIGGFWEYLFIDEVDHEFCYRIHEKGYKIIRRNDIAIKHRLGEPSTVVILGHTFHPTNHSPLRRYYISRNNIIMNFLFPEDEGVFADRLSMIKNTCISVMACENNKAQKIKAIIKGIIDGKRWCKKYDGAIDRRDNKQTPIK